MSVFPGVNNLKRTAVVHIDKRYDNLSGSGFYLTLMMTSAKVVEPSVTTPTTVLLRKTRHPEDQLHFQNSQ